MRCRETAEVAGLAPELDEALAECDFGAWMGRRLADVGPDGARAWMHDPDAAPHGGETLRAFAARVAACVVKAAVVHALDAPLRAFWQIDAAPLSLTELHAHDGRWTVARLNHLVAA